MSSRVVIVGGGNAGISLAARLLRDGHDDVTICDGRREHRYRPLLNYVGAGLADLRRIRRPLRSVVPDGARLVADDVVSVDISARTVTTRSGQEVAYDVLVLATGLLVDHGATSGESDAYASGWAVSTFVDETAEEVWRRVHALRSGTAVFTVPPEPAPCAATALKPLLMACDWWRRRGVLERISVHLVLPGDRPVPLADEASNEPIERRLRDLGVTVHRDAVVAALDAGSHGVTIRATLGETRLHGVDLPHVVPRYRAPDWIAEAGLATGPAGLADVDPETLRHRTRPEVWALGDVADLGMPPSGGALRDQVEVLAHNLTAAPDDLRHYDGYTVMPVTLDRRRLSLLEVDRTGRRAPTVPFPDLTRPRLATWLVDRYALPQVYFRRILRGRV